MLKRSGMRSLWLVVLSSGLLFGLAACGSAQGNRALAPSEQDAKEPSDSGDLDSSDAESTDTVDGNNSNGNEAEDENTSPDAGSDTESSEPDAPTDVDNDTPDEVDEPQDDSQEDEEEETSQWDGCTRVGFQAVQEIADTEEDNLSYRASQGPDSYADFLEVASYSNWNGPTTPGTYSLDGINYQDCGLCLRIWAGCDGESCDKQFYADEGAVQIDSIGPDGTAFIGSFIGVVFKESTFDSDYTSVEVVNGERWCLDGYSFSQEIGGGATTNDPVIIDDEVDTVADDSPAAGDNGGPGTGDLDADENCELTLRAEVRDESGSCVSCTAGDYITVVGVIENNCSQPRTYQSEKSCLVSEFDVSNLVHGSSSNYPMTCDEETRLEALQPGESVTQTRPAGRLSSGSYLLTVQFEDAVQTAETLSFSVE